MTCKELYTGDTSRSGYEIGKEQSYGDRNEDRMVQIKEETQKTGYHNYQKGEIGLKRSNRVKRLN